MVDYLSAVDSLAGIAILALVAFLDSLIGASFFVFGEIAFLAAGASFASDGAITPALTVLIFAYAGDMVSFALGRRYGKRLVVRFLQPCKRRRAWRKAQTALKKRGAVFVVLSRFMGPLAWVTPFMAGVVGMQYRVFAWAAAIGVVLAVGQFLLLGALGLMLIGPLISFVVTHAVVIVLCSTIVFVSIYLWCQCKQSILRRLCHIAGVSVLVFLTANFAYFFVFNFHPVSNAPWQKLNYACDLNDYELVVQAGNTQLHLPQPINVILLSEKTGEHLMADLGWQQNATFTNNEISFASYVQMLIKRVPPISELYFQQRPADSAFQMPGTLITREHIRWWTVGSNIHIAALSRDDEIAIKYYLHLPTLLHDIDPLVDLSRDRLASQVINSKGFEVAGVAYINAPVVEGAFSDFMTDGGVLVLTDKGQPLSSELAHCLQIKAIT